MNATNTERCKRTLRNRVKKRWQRLAPGLRQKLNVNAVHRVKAHDYFIHAETVCLYAGDPFDLNIGGIMRDCPKRFAFPEIMSQTKLIFRHVSAVSDLKIGKHRILSPPSAFPEIAPHDADLIIVPAQAADTKGYRLGRGGGYYDRVLGNVGPQTKLLCVIPYFSFFQSLPVEPHDRRIHQIIVVVPHAKT